VTYDSCEITALGERTVPSPKRLSTHHGDGRANYIEDGTRVMRNISARPGEEFDTGGCFEQAGPREKIYFDPSATRAGIVTCGGMSPGLNNVIRALFLELHFHYGVSEVIGFRYGYRGLNPDHGLEPIVLSSDIVRTIHNDGGSILGCSRGAEDVAVIVDRLLEMKINVLYCVGGDGTLKGAHAIHEEVARRGAGIAVVGVPKTIDNDILFVYKSFGLDTAVGVVKQALEGAHVEAVGTPNGIGLVKVMGRDSGFIAAYGTLASGEPNFCLIPEVPFDLHGEGGFLSVLEHRIRDRGHAVIIVAEGAGQRLFADADRDRDSSGNVLHKDIGLLLKQEIHDHFQATGINIHLKYIDPSYMIRSVRANASDAILCNNLARHAAHAGMAGKTDVLIGLWHGRFVHVPIPLSIRGRKKINPESYLWRDVIAATGQPASMCADGA
jgi:6-phosphofructokinase 1